MKGLIRYYKNCRTGLKLLNNQYYLDAQKKTTLERSKTPKRTDIVNYLLSLLKRDTLYMEIGVRNPDDNFTHIKANTKYSVDPGLEFKQNPVDFKLTSDEFFAQLREGKILPNIGKFDVIFIDGLHLAEQVERDIKNALDFIADDGFIVLHDCNPPTAWHGREKYHFHLTPALDYWNGTTWKGFMKARFNASVNSCCIDTDWGVGILSKTQTIGSSIEPTNLYYEYDIFDKNRKEHLNLMSFDELKKLIK